MSQEIISALQSTVERMIGCFQALLPLFEQEEQAIRKRKIEELESLNEQIIIVLHEIKTLSDQRQQSTVRLGQLLGLPKDRLSLKDLDEAMGGSAGLLDLRQRLINAIEKADVANKKNQAVVKGVEMATNAILRTLTKNDGDGGYDRKGALQQTRNFHMFSKQL